MIFWIHPSARYKQLAKMRELSNEGFRANVALIASFCAVVYQKGNSAWVFGLDGSIEYIADIKLL